MRPIDVSGINDAPNCSTKNDIKFQKLKYPLAECGSIFIGKSKFLFTIVIIYRHYAIKDYLFLIIDWETVGVDGRRNLLYLLFSIPPEIMFL